MPDCPRVHHLFIPDWHASATPRAHDGAVALRAAFGDLQPLIDVPVEPAGDPSAAQDGIVFRGPVLKQLRTAIRAIEHAAPSRLFSILGTCGAELAPVSYLNARYRGDLAVVWLDAHGDLNTPHTSPSKRFHGMVLRALLGDRDSDLSDLVAAPLTPRQVVLAGTRDLDPPEREYIDAVNISLVKPDTADAFSDAVVSAVRATGCRHAYVHLDLDVLDPAEFPNVLVPAPGGVSLAAVDRTLRALAASSDCVGLSIVEYAPGPRDLTNVVVRLAREAGVVPIT